MNTVSPTKSSPDTVSAEPTENLNVVGFRSIISPHQLTAALPITQRAHDTCVLGRRAIRKILRRQDDRVLAVVGPCSVHDVDAAYEYAEKLHAVAKQVEDRLCVVMRVYFEKPRTIVGWKGLINDPHLDGSFDVSTGLTLARELLLQINELGMPAATELLEPITPQYIDDLISWAAIGARTTESQTHRQMASGLSMPVGYKNGTDGTLQVAIDAFRAAQSGHHFLGVDEDGKVCIVQTRGNRDGHIILRGGKGASNYDATTIAQAAGLLQQAGLPQTLMVDCSHANSGKKHENQAIVWREVFDQIATSRAAGQPSPIVGIMLESNLAPGRQDIPPNGRAGLEYGVSITDACLGWDDTEALLLEAHRRLA
jgi:3-deoxy-7-phosphoheptulonate synthase